MAEGMKKTVQARPRSSDGYRWERFLKMSGLKKATK